MTLNGISTIGSLYTGYTAASSSSTTIIVPSLTPPSEKEDDPESEAEEVSHQTMTEEKPADPYYYQFCPGGEQTHANHTNYNEESKNTPNPYYEYSAYIHKKTSATVLPLPIYTTTAAATTKTAPRTLPRPVSLSPMTSSPSSPSPTLATSPKKKAKRWMIAALIVIVGLLIALTFILIGLGKAISHHHRHHHYHHQNQPNRSHSSFLSLLNTHPTTTVLIVPTISTILPSASL